MIVWEPFNWHCLDDCVPSIKPCLNLEDVVGICRDMWTVGPSKTQGTSKKLNIYIFWCTLMHLAHSDHKDWSEQAPCVKTTFHVVEQAGLEAYFSWQTHSLARKWGPGTCRFCWIFRGCTKFLQQLRCDFLHSNYGRPSDSISPFTQFCKSMRLNVFKQRGAPAGRRGYGSMMSPWWPTMLQNPNDF